MSVGIALEFIAPPQLLLIFLMAALAIMPLAGRLGQATVARTG